MSSGSGPSSHGAPGGGEKLGLMAKGALLSPAIVALQGLFALGLCMPVMAKAFPKEPNAVLLCELVASVAGLTFALASPPAGRLIDRYGYRTILLWSTVLFALVGAIPAGLDNLYLILATRALLGVVVAGALGAGVVGVARMDPAAQARMFGLQSLAGGLAAIAVFPLLGTLARLNWRYVFAIHLVFLLFVPLILALPRRASAQPAITAASRETGPAEPIPWPLVIFGGVLGMALVLPGVLLPFFMAGMGISDPRVIALPIAGAAFSSMLASAAYGSLEKRIGVVGSFAAGLPLMAVGFTVIGLSQSLGQVAAGLVLGSLGTGTVVPNLFSAVVRKAPVSPGRVVGVTNAALYGTQVLLPFVASGISRLAGPAAVFFAFAVAAGCGAVFYLTSWLRPSRAAVGRQTSPG